MVLTNVPEVNLAIERKWRTQQSPWITNYAAGISENALTHSEVVEMMGEMASQLKALILGTIEAIDMNADYAAHHRMAEYGWI